MAEETKYSPVSYVYSSRGLNARDELDEQPPYFYLQFMNALERQEHSLSSRYGTLVLNRDPNGTPNGTNYFFSSPIASISKLTYAGAAFRYAGLSDGSLWRRAGNNQGQYTQIYQGLSGNPFQSLISSCYQTSQAFLFIADQSLSLKDVGTGTPQLWGIDPPSTTADALPFSPLLTLIDNFASGNSYDASGFDDGWAYSPVASIIAGSGMMVTDFPQFFDAGTPLAGGDATAVQVGLGSVGQETVLSGFPSVGVAAGQVVTVIVQTDANAETTGIAGGGGYAVSNTSYEYSTDSGATWTPFGGFDPLLDTIETVDFPFAFTLAISGLTNLDTLQFKIVVVSGVYGSSSLTLTTVGTIISIVAGVADAGIFGEVCNGILSVRNTDSVTTVPIVSISPSGLSGDVYTTLTVVTGSPHGASTGQNLSIYGASNDLADGFYPATVIDSTTLTVPFLAPVGTPLNLSATGGTLQWVSASDGPNTCVLTDEYSTPYPAQFAAWGFYQQVPLTASNFPVGSWTGQVDTDSTATVAVTTDLNLSMNNQVTDSDLIILTLQVGSPANISNIRLQFDVNGSGFTSSYYYANISPAYYQGNIANQISAYNSTQNQILADALGLVTGQPPSTTTAQLQPSNMSTGSDSWIAVLIPRGNFLPVGSAGQSGLDWTNITGWEVIIETTATPITGDGSSTIAMNGLYLQWGYGPSSFAGVGYDYRYTYYNLATGTESSPSGEMEFNQQYGYLSSLSAPFYLRQAAQVSGVYSTDPQVTHYRVYRRGGIYANNWLLIDQIPNITGDGQFLYKDVVPDASLAQAQPLALDNDPPVTSSLVTPISTTLSQATTGPGNSIYSTYAPQLIEVADSTAVFVENQTVLLGNAYNLEEILVITGGTGQFTAIVRLQHNAGEQVQVNSVPRIACDLCAIVNLPGGATQVILAGDKNNPQRVYYAKPGQPENFGPENYVDTASSGDPVTALINWRGTSLVATQATWYVFVGGAKPYLQPTGAAHGIVGGWCLAEGVIPFRAADGWRFFSGADGKYMTLPVEWIFRTNPECLPPQANTSDYAQDVFAFYNNCVYGSYISLNDGDRYRLVYDTVYSRFRQDDIAATAMLWEKDTNLLVCGVPVYASDYLQGYAIIADQQYNQDYDDGGWGLNGVSPQLTVTSFNWSNPQNATSIFPSVYASSQISILGNNLQCVAAPLDIPAEATVTGISISFDAWGLIGNTLPVKAGVFLGGVLSAQLPTPNITADPTPYTLGSSSFQWGFAMTPALLNAGLTVFVYGGYEHLGIGITNLNDLVVTVYYSLGAGLFERPIRLNLQTPYRDLGKPHFPKNWNTLEVDVDTQGQELQTTLWFDSGEASEIVLPPINSGSQRQKIQQQINAGEGNQSYSMSVQHQMDVTIAPTIYQLDIYAALLADYRSSFDTYWQKAGGQNRLKLWKQCYIDYSCTEPVIFSLYANGDSDKAYYQFTLPVQVDREVVRVLFPAMKCRLWRMIGVSTGDFQLWAPVTVESKELEEGSGYMEGTYGVYE